MLWRAYALLSHAGDRVGIRPQRVGGLPPVLKRPGDVIRLTERLDEAVWAANAILVAVESGMVEHLAETTDPAEIGRKTGMPEAVVEAVAGILASLGLVTQDPDGIRATPGLAAFADPERKGQLAATLRAPLLQTADLRRRAAERTLDLEGWRHFDSAVIEAQGELTAALTSLAVPKLRFLPGLAAQLSRPGARLLDVGAGAAGLSIELCRHFPHLTAVALEPAPAPAKVAEGKIAAAGLTDRIELRRSRVEHLDESDAFDLVFLPQMFLPNEIMPATVANVFRAMRPRAWLLVAVLSRKGADLRASVARLKNLIWGGNTRDDDVLKGLLAGAGFSPVIRSPGSEALRMICARRPP